MAFKGKSAPKRVAPETTPSRPTKRHRKGAQASKHEDDSRKRRGKPVTAPAVSGDSEDTEEDDDGHSEQEMYGEDDMEVLEEGDEHDTLADEGVLKANKQGNSKESHKAQKVLHNERKASKPHSALLSEAKKLWSLAHKQNIPKNERQRHIKALMNLIRGKVQDIVIKHDASRIIQTIVKYGGQSERDEIAAELKGRYKQLAQEKYSKFLVTKLIRRCPTHRTSILHEFQGNVIRLLLHREASGVIADAYELYGNAFERAMLLYDFYGKEVILFSNVRDQAPSESDKETIKKGLAGVLEGADQTKRKRILSAVKENITLILNNDEKGAVSHGIVHRAIWEYLTAVKGIEDASERDTLWRECFDGCSELIAEMVHTRDGGRVVREFIAEGSAKDRKQIVKVLKPHVERICLDEEAHFVLFAALDIIDDTKLTGKSLVVEVTSNAAKLWQSPQGRRSLLYLLVHRSTRHFTPAQIETLKQTDATKARTSKKDDQVRMDEIRKAASPDLLNLLIEDGKADSMIRDTGGSLLVGEIMLYADGDKSKASESLLQLLTSPYPAPEDKIPHVIDIPHSSRIYKRLLEGGHFSHQTHSVVKVPTWSPSEFASAWLRMVGQESTIKIALGEGAFVVAALCDRIQENGSQAERERLRSWFDPKTSKLIQEGTMRGKDILFEKLAVLGKTA